MYIRKVPSQNEYIQLENLPNNTILIKKDGIIAIKNDKDVIFFDSSNISFGKVNLCCEKYKIFSGQLILENP